jgi:hypothetical protein
MPPELVRPNLEDCAAFIATMFFKADFLAHRFERLARENVSDAHLYRQLATALRDFHSSVSTTMSPAVVAAIERFSK